MSEEKYRLVTRSDFDGLVCAVLLNELNLIDEITFVHPKDMQDGKVAITSRDITTNLPYVASAGLAATAELPTTVMPFIIRGVSLLGVASAGTARDIREQVWQHLGDDWKPRHLDTICTREVGLDGLPEVFATMLGGGSFGRTLVRID